MLIYILNILSLFVWKAIYDNSPDKTKWKKIIIIGIVLQFSLIQGLRSISVGTDTETYSNYYNYAQNVSYSFLEWYTIEKTKMEPAWILLMQLCSFLNLSENMFLLVVACIINGLLGYFIYKNSNDFIFSFWLFICLEFFTLSFTMLRQMIAILIIANIFTYLINRNIKKYYLGCFIAIMFHKTAILFLLVYPAIYLINKVYNILQEKIRSKDQLILIKLLILMIMILFLKLGIEPVIYFMDKIMYGYYTNYEKISLGGLWFEILFLCILFILIEKFILHNKELMYYQVYAIFSVLIQYCTIYVSHLSRLTFYFSILFIISVPFVCSKIGNSKIRISTKYVIMLLSFVQYILYSLDVYNLVPYKLFL